MNTYIITTTNMRKFEIKADNEEMVEVLANNLLEDIEGILMIQKK